METKLQRIAQIAKENPKEKFSALIHHVNKEMLMQCHKELKGNKAAGVDGITKLQYEENLEENIDDLLARMKRFNYRPKPSKRVYIPKPGSHKKRPLGIPCYEDKLVQLAFNKVITSIYEQDFLDCSYGFRPNRNCHDTLKQLDVYLSRRNVNYVVDADIKGFFDNVDHEWLMKFLAHRISDRNLLRYIKRFLKSGIMEDGSFHKSYEGTPQGGIISPTLANIYLHYALDLWFEIVVKKQCQGEAYMVRYADDFVCCFQYEDEAKAFYNALGIRLAKFNLALAEEKSNIIFFGKEAYLARKAGVEWRAEIPKTFDFLGFTHYCSARVNGNYRVKRKTSNEKFRASLLRFKEWLHINMHTPLKILVQKLNRKLIGYYRYYGITDNIYALKRYRDCIQRQLFWVLNRRNQNGSYSWEAFNQMKKTYPIVRPKIYVNMFEVKPRIS